MNAFLRIVHSNLEVGEVADIDTLAHVIQTDTQQAESAKTRKLATPQLYSDG